MALHACANCRHFVSKGQVRCMIPGTERVLDWRAGNRCKSFEFSNVSGNMPKSPEETWIAKAAEGGGSARDVWNNLFKP